MSEIPGNGATSFLQNTISSPMGSMVIFVLRLILTQQNSTNPMDVNDQIIALKQQITPCIFISFVFFLFYQRRFISTMTFEKVKNTVSIDVKWSTFIAA